LTLALTEPKTGPAEAGGSSEVAAMSEKAGYDVAVVGGGAESTA